MSIKIFKAPFAPYRDWCDTKMFFDLNGQDYTYVGDIQDADVILVDLQSPYDKYMSTTTPKLFLEMFHNYEGQSTEIDIILNRYNNCLAISNLYNTSALTIHNDFLFNRTKAYYLGYEFSANTTKWYFDTQENYVMPVITSADNKTKIYVAPNKTYLNTEFRTIKHRPKIVKLLKEQYSDLGYIGNPDDSKFALVPNSVALTNTRVLDKLSAGNYAPPHNFYYQDSFLSVYGETVEYGVDTIVTEKTYDPLIKGHFILPFSSVNFIAYLKTLGFRFPEFINYSYDSVEDDVVRYELYQTELTRLLNIPIAQWKQHWNDNLDVLQDNQSLFINKSYDRVDLLKILQEM